jgi:hypothetical protein
MRGAVPPNVGSILLSNTPSPSGSHPASYRMGRGDGIKRQEREADHSPLSSAEVKDAWSYTFTSPIRLHGVVLKEQGQLYLYHTVKL